MSVLPVRAIEFHRPVLKTQERMAIIRDTGSASGSRKSRPQGQGRVIGNADIIRSSDMENAGERGEQPARRKASAEGLQRRGRGTAEEDFADMRARQEPEDALTPA